MSARSEILARILRHKENELIERKQRVPLEKMQEWAADAPVSRGFEAALRGAQLAERPGVIAEIKRASPSKGILRADFDPIQIAAGYQANGTTCVSVLTDGEFFKGSCVILELVRKACFAPILRKDFIIDPYQIYETRAVNADCLLLIVAALTDERMAEFYRLARDLHLDVLVEVHDEDELRRALQLEPTLLGINNRNLHTFEVSLDTTLRLLPEIPPTCHVVTESGIHSKDDVAMMIENGINSFLVGEVFMTAEDPGAALKELFF